jgi:hypothetical protein
VIIPGGIAFNEAASPPTMRSREPGDFTGVIDPLLGDLGVTTTTHRRGVVAMSFEFNEYLVSTMTNHHRSPSTARTRQPPVRRPLKSVVLRRIRRS